MSQELGRFYLPRKNLPGTKIRAAQPAISIDGSNPPVSGTNSGWRSRHTNRPVREIIFKFRFTATYRRQIPPKSLDPHPPPDLVLYRTFISVETGHHAVTTVYACTRRWGWWGSDSRYSVRSVIPGQPDISGQEQQCITFSDGSNTEASTN